MQQRAPPRKMISSSHSLPCISEPECTSRQVKIYSTPAVRQPRSSESERRDMPGPSADEDERLLEQIGADRHVCRGALDQHVTRNGTGVTRQKSMGTLLPRRFSC